MNSSTFLQRRHFEFIARVLKAELNGAIGAYGDGIAGVATKFADELAHTNPQFNREKFLKACGVTP